MHGARKGEVATGSCSAWRAGVGKTYRMLQEGPAGAGEGRDVVIGYLEPHDRPETAALAEGLESCRACGPQHGGARARGDGHGRRHRRAPELALVDELAHTNAPVMRNEKRYQDIDEILDAGIDVISTVNVQHLESLNDAVFELTDVRVRETFPDRILDEADEVVLVDLSPEALQRAAAGGQGLPDERAEVALGNFFRVENLGPCASSRCGGRRGRRERAAAAGSSLSAGRQSASASSR